ncbi:hypothetical protein NBRC3188_1798 [Acetobacter pasteurianus NBRC 3188]|uniref:Uncharacterized protein n=1 Tax=Acetobacter pasteurianus NBRC 3188 TaxID=1226663 RepID=A0A401WUS9_ACEPA|nr:hypothetical protein NBRC3188_1798 [Acetobacter pasteurianus NBRC 3188]
MTADINNIVVSFEYPVGQACIAHELLGSGLIDI